MLVAETGNWRLQTLSVVAAMYIIALIALAAIYSGLALSAIVGGFALGGCWLAIVRLDSGARDDPTRYCHSRTATAKKWLLELCRADQIREGLRMLAVRSRL